MMRRLVPAFPLLFAVLWSTGFIGARLGLPHSEPLTFLFVRYLLVAALLLVLAVLSKAPWPARGRDWFHIGVAGLLIHGVYLGGVFIAISIGLPAGVAALVVGLQPLLVAVGAGLLLRETVVRRQWLGLALGLAGVALVLARVCGLPLGDATLLAVLASSASYIAVPAAARIAIPKADPSMYIGLALAVTFPINVVVGIPLYLRVAHAMWGA